MNTSLQIDRPTRFLRGHTRRRRRFASTIYPCHHRQLLRCLVCLALGVTTTVSTNLRAESGTGGARNLPPEWTKAATWGGGSDSRDCATVLTYPGKNGRDVEGESILFLKPGETVLIERVFFVAWQAPRETKNRGIGVSWVAFPEAGIARPSTGRDVLRDDWGSMWGELDGRTYVYRRHPIQFSYTAPESQGKYLLPFQVVLDSASASLIRIPASCHKARFDWTVVVGEAQYGVSITGQYSEPGGARTGLTVSGAFNIDSNGKATGRATHENWILGDCVQYRDSIPQKIDGWVEGGRIHLRFNKAGEPTATTDNVNKEDASCMFKGLKELGTLLALVGSDLAKQTGAANTSTARLPGGLAIPGEVTFPLLKPGGEDTQSIGNLRYKIRRRE